MHSRQLAKPFLANPFLFGSCVALACLAMTPRVGPAETPKPIAAAKPALLDLDRHMPLVEVKSGMKGYGLSVYAGSEIKRFEVEVVAVLKNIFGPSQDAILIRCLDDYLTHTGPVEGMSGSPIYLFDSTGKARMIGAFAYGWEAQKDPVAGVQPIENMLGLDAPKPVAQAGNLDARNVTYNLLDADVIPSLSQIKGVSLVEFLRGKNKVASPHFNTTSLRPLTTPLAVSGLSIEAADLLSQSLSTSHNSKFSVRPLSGSMVAMPSPDAKVPDTIEPGGSLIAPVITGDLDAAAVGTATEVIGNRVMGFGHPFNGDGPVSMPMASGTIATIIATNTTSFKMGATGKLVGTIDYDTTFGIAGNLGPVPPMIPMTVNVKLADGSLKTFNYNAAWHPTLTPRLAAMAVMGSALQRHNLPKDHTLNYTVRMEFGKHMLTRDASRVIEFSNAETSLMTEGLVRQVAGPMMAMTDNPFGTLVPRRVTVDINVWPKINAADIRNVVAHQNKYAPGDAVKLTLSVRKFQGDDLDLPLTFALPKDLKEGQYTLFVTDAVSHTAAEIQYSPGQFDAKSPDDIVQLINTFAGKRNDAIYLRLVPTMPQVDVHVGRTTLSGLPGSMRSRIATVAGPNIQPGIKTLNTVVATDQIIQGSGQVVIRVERE
jgi:hypothetical protein